MPRRSGHPGVRRWSPEDGGEGLRRVHLLRPLVRRKATIKSTEAMRYSSWKKAKRNDISQAQFPYKITKDISRTQFDKPTASQKNYRTSSATEQVRSGGGTKSRLIRCRACRDSRTRALKRRGTRRQSRRRVPHGFRVPDAADTDTEYAPPRPVPPPHRG